MSNVAIKVENLSKAYQLGQIGTGTISRDMERWIAKIRGKEDPFLRIGETNDRSTKGSSDIVWSLKDINFEIEQGDAVGIIGRNGAGKSTLLKILSKVTAPTTGKISGKGRIASLLEVGTGFHPELSGRENIFLNGAILGMRKKEIQRKFDEIVDFAGIERYIDTPVKRYSSGMYVRLAFAVAAHLESEILIVDEVLAVGDTEFQKKCLGKMSDVSKGEGRTVLFVSHNMGAVKQLCQKTIVLDNGTILFNGSVEKGFSTYLTLGTSSKQNSYANHSIVQNGFKSIKLSNAENILTNSFSIDEEIVIEVVFSIEKNYFHSKLGLKFTDNFDRIIFTTEDDIKRFINPNGEGTAKITVPKHLLVPNVYNISFALHIPNVEFIEHLQNLLSFEINENDNALYQYSNNEIGCVYVNCTWEK
ncbi:MAG: ABC transporter ATP-binding protein [Pedobacter sp.]|nr:MAG: ABC transporter ATP-binding protein [Pedobacter sp.]